MESISDSKEKEKGRVQRVLSGKERGRMSKILMWIVWNIPLGRLAPIVLGWALGVKGERIDDKEDTNECERNL